MLCFIRYQSKETDTTNVRNIYDRIVGADYLVFSCGVLAFWSTPFFEKDCGEYLFWD